MYSDVGFETLDLKLCELELLELTVFCGLGINLITISILIK